MPGDSNEIQCGKHQGEALGTRDSGPRFPSPTPGTFGRVGVPGSRQRVPGASGTRAHGQQRGSCRRCLGVSPAPPLLQAALGQSLGLSEPGCHWCKCRSSLWGMQVAQAGPGHSRPLVGTRGSAGRIQRHGERGAAGGSLSPLTAGRAGRTRPQGPPPPPGRRGKRGWAAAWSFVTAAPGGDPQAQLTDSHSLCRAGLTVSEARPHGQGAGTGGS